MNSEEKKNKIIKILFYSWFIISIYLMIEYSEHILLLLGQYFLVFSIIAIVNIKNKSEKIIGFIMLFISIACILCYFLNYINKKMEYNINIDNLVMLTILILFLVICLGIIIWSILKYKKQKANNKDTKKQYIIQIIIGIFGITFIAACSYLYIKYTLPSL